MSVSRLRNVLARVLGETERARPLPRLVALVVEPPIVMPARVVVGIRRSRLLLVAAAILIATTFVASGIAGAWVERLTAPNRAPDALERLQSLGTVRIAVSPDRVVDSFDTDVARALAERLGLPVSMVAVETSDLTASVASWDVALPMAPEWSLDRDEFAVTEPYYAWPRRFSFPRNPERHRWPTSRANQSARSPATLASAGSWGRWATPGPSLATAPPLPSAMILRDTDAACLAALEDGTVRAVVTAAMSPTDVAARTDLRSVGKASARTPSDRGVAPGPDPSALIAAIEDSLDDMRRDGTLGRLFDDRVSART